MTDQALSILLQHERIVITTHLRPDGDAAGSQLALGRFLQKLGKRVMMINTDPPPFTLGWMPGIDDIERFDGSLSQRERIAAADVVAVVDTNALDRLGHVGVPIRNSAARKLLIDHHPHPEAWFDVACVRETASSTGELVYEIIAAHDPSLIDAEIATALYTAIMTDTGSFRYSNVSPALHRIIADLLERGDIRPEPIHTSLYDARSLQGLHLLGQALDGITLRYDGQVGYMVIAQRMLNDTGAGVEETEGFVNYVLSISGVKAALIFIETERGTKISFRSRGEVNVSDWARALGGGGHRNASGAFVTRPLDEVIDLALEMAPRFVPIETTDETTGDLSDEDASYLSALMDLQARSGRRR